MRTEANEGNKGFSSAKHSIPEGWRGFQPLTAMVDGKTGHYSPQILVFVFFARFCNHLRRVL
jgi:hypothetical protein